MERAVLDQLADYFNRRLAGYPTTLNEDESLVILVIVTLTKLMIRSELMDCEFY